MPHPSINPGDIVAAGRVLIDDEMTDYHIVYVPGRHSKGLCPQHDIKTLEALRFTIRPHWVEYTHRQGHRAVQEVHFKRGSARVSPNVLNILAPEGITNSHLAKQLLEQEVDSHDHSSTPTRRRRHR